MLVVCLCMHLLLTLLHPLYFLDLKIIQVLLNDPLFEIKLSILIVFDSLFMGLGLLSQGLCSGSCLFPLVHQVDFHLTLISLSLIQARFVQIITQCVLERKALIHIKHLELEERAHSLFLVPVQNVFHRKMVLVPFVKLLGVGCGLTS